MCLCCLVSVQARCVAGRGAVSVPLCAPLTLDRPQSYTLALPEPDSTLCLQSNATSTVTAPRLLRPAPLIPSRPRPRPQHVFLSTLLSSELIAL